MKAESNIKPQKQLEIENLKGDRCDIVLFENIQEISENDETKYTFDIYRMNICYDEKLKEATEETISKYILSSIFIGISLIIN